MYNPFAAPATPNILNNEFNNNIDDWTLYNHGGNTAATLVKAGLRLSQTTTPGEAIGGLILPLPDTDFTIETHVSAQYQEVPSSAAYSLVGLILLENNTNTGKLLHYNLLNNSDLGSFLICDKYNNYGSNSLADRVISTGIARNTNSMFLRIRRNTNDFFGDFSRDGVGWKNLWQTTLTYTPTYIGLSIDYASYTPTSYAIFSFFRYTDSDLTVAGNIGGLRTESNRGES